MSSNFQSHRKFTAAEYANYDNTRKKVYGPESVRLTHPTPEAQQAYETYSKWTTDSNKSVKQYNEKLKAVSGKKKSDLNKFDIGTLHQEQHQTLVEPAAQAATDTNMHASTRNAFLDDYPYAYFNGRARQKHERHADEATQQAEFYRNRYDTHLSEATASTASAFRPTDSPYGTYGSAGGPTGNYDSYGPSGSGTSDSGAYRSQTTGSAVHGAYGPPFSNAGAYDSYSSRTFR
ncbi:hypothetical protein BGZ63DRAFT_399318 [Mariannaea sp. PMI_226]|nr:hypothetical protein BGZ63DRAFT_399318 [Mariannaea sp. PMI_226]